MRPVLFALGQLGDIDAEGDVDAAACERVDAVIGHDVDTSSCAAEGGSCCAVHRCHVSGYCHNLQVVDVYAANASATDEDRFADVGGRPLRLC